MSIVIDCSIVMAWCFSDESSARADDVLLALEKEDAIVPAIWPFEVANVLAVGKKRGRISQSGISKFLNILSALPIIIEEESIPRALRDTISIADKLSLSAYDASYIELAVRTKSSFATSDKKLVAAAKKVGLRCW